ncbi:MAG: hypothetical protein UY58_C0004G0020 [Candidatus Magasanikbacteria bacterium GW2011_GWA2_50_22]|uniref:GatB/YqeY domain-containing protein n=1 Tax=Candidatus Magasanikbacteria bacterium GW2011_GWA2_50_22 TaxID=1619043 RepID=A0A0G1WF24_9BACT|nr:MAG: hypothetical protein UY58_C0004G0020 [Candidatus Magasanikbacteria bacterium GW2011_GWA2_50_22]
MNFIQTIEEDYKRAFRQQDKLFVAVLRLVKTALTNAEIEKRAKVGSREATLTDEEALATVKRHIKQLEEAGELFRQGGREDLLKQNEAELLVLKKYVPASLPEETVREAVKKVLAGLPKAGPGDFGKIMGLAMKELAGKADGALVGKIVKEILGN